MWPARNCVTGITVNHQCICLLQRRIFFLLLPIYQPLYLAIVTPHSLNTHHYYYATLSQCTSLLLRHALSMHITITTPRSLNAHHYYYATIRTRLVYDDSMYDDSRGIERVVLRTTNISSSLTEPAKQDSRQ